MNLTNFHKIIIILLLRYNQKYYTNIAQKNFKIYKILNKTISETCSVYTYYLCIKSCKDIPYKIFLLEIISSLNIGLWLGQIKHTKFYFYILLNSLLYLTCTYLYIGT